MTEYQIEFFDHSDSEKIEYFLNRLREDGISVSGDNGGLYTLIADRDGKADRLRFYLFESAYSKNFKVIKSD